MWTKPKHSCGHECMPSDTIFNTPEAIASVPCYNCRGKTDKFYTVFQLEQAVAKEREECAQLAENWGNAPPNPLGRRAALAKVIRARGKQ